MAEQSLCATRVSRSRVGYRYVSPRGYVYVTDHDNSHANDRGFVLEHVKVVTDILGKPLPKGAEIHHIDEDRSNNSPSNLVVCQDSKYHKLLHQRLRAKKACGHASWRQCHVCKVWDAPENLHIHPKSKPYHRPCMRATWARYRSPEKAHAAYLRRKLRRASA